LTFIFVTISHKNKTPVAPCFFISSKEDSVILQILLTISIHCTLLKVVLLFVQLTLLV